MKYFTLQIEKNDIKLFNELIFYFILNIIGMSLIIC